ncbi:hypothetical protein CEXT_473591 [Caerostris extrusa]|uniref:Uncharacterized protein n=1 Tax=Caerostris extrusa TaxID=172846 RepID=A0AAV4TP54_CAEEX|nr:hypothetical protein CEXT_473591 [Caerostris extrusa]
MLLGSRLFINSPTRINLSPTAFSAESKHNARTGIFTDRLVFPPPHFSIQTICSAPPRWLKIVLGAGWKSDVFREFDMIGSVF